MSEALTPSPAEQELARFDREWNALHPRQLVDMDRDPVTEPKDEVPTGVMKMRINASGYTAAKREFIRNNPIIQAALAEEVKRKAALIKARQLVEVAVAVTVANSGRRGRRL